MLPIRPQIRALAEAAEALLSPPQAAVTLNRDEADMVLLYLNALDERVIKDTSDLVAT